MVPRQRLAGQKVTGGKGAFSGPEATVWIFPRFSIGHWVEWVEVMRRLSGGMVATGWGTKLRALFSRGAIVLVAGDNAHLPWAPVMVVRALLGGGGARSLSPSPRRGLASLVGRTRAGG